MRGGRCARAVVFDLGGVVIRWNTAPTFRRVARDVGVPWRVVRAALEVAALPLARGEISEAEFWDDLARRLGQSIPRSVRGTWARDFARDAFPEPAVVRWISQLRVAGYQVACLSNIITPHARVLRARGWLQPFSPALLSNELGAVKPDRRVYHLAQKRIGLPPCDLLLIDDLAENVAGARAAGWAAHRFVSLQLARQVVERWGESSSDSRGP
jgi:epoxide hydrolase-like predicted phosphatase